MIWSPPFEDGRKRPGVEQEYLPMAHQLSWLYHSISPHKGDSLFNLPPQGSSLYYLILSCAEEWTSMVAQMVKNLPPMQETQVQSLGQEDPPGEGNSYPFQYSCLENSMDREAWWVIVQGFAKSQIQLSDTHTYTHTHSEEYSAIFQFILSELVLGSLTSYYTKNLVSFITTFFFSRSFFFNRGIVES